MFQKQIEPYHVSLHRTQRNLAEYCTIENIHFIVIYDELESNLAQINVIRCKFIIMQMNTRA
jgi:ubiquinone biosynthesis protein UbiJ